MSLISHAVCLGLSPVILAKIHSQCASQPKIAKNSLKPLFWAFKVVQGHRCWYLRKASQCLLWCAASLCLSATVLLLDWTTGGGTQIWCTRMKDSLKWFRRNSLLKCVSQSKIAKNSLKPQLLGFKIVQGHRCWYHRKARQQYLLRWTPSLCLSATVLTLVEPIVVKLRFLTGVPLFDAIVRGESPHPAAPNYLTRNVKL